MKKNVGTIDALFRITIGLFGLAWGISKMTRSPHRSWPKLVAFQGAMKAAEGMIRFCPLLALLGKNTLDQPEQGRSESSQQTVFTEEKPAVTEASSH